MRGDTSRSGDLMALKPEAVRGLLDSKPSGAKNEMFTQCLDATSRDKSRLSEENTEQSGAILSLSSCQMKANKPIE